MRFINRIPLEALITQLLRNPHLLGVIALSEAEDTTAPAPATRQVVLEASSKEAGTCIPQVILWEAGKPPPPVRWLLMEFADQGRLIVRTPVISYTFLQSGIALQILLAPDSCSISLQ